jgi:arginase family enzyme
LYDLDRRRPRRSGTRFGPHGMRKISALPGPYSFDLGVDLRESITIADLGDVFTIPANIEKTFLALRAQVEDLVRTYHGAA